MGTFSEPLYEDAEQLQYKVSEYFNSIAEEGTKPTVAKLAYFLGFTSRQSIYDYKALNDGRSYIIKRALLLIEDYHESGLSKQSNSGHIFWLKNHDWTDKYDNQISGSLFTPKHELSKEQIDKLIDKL